jgi:nucleotide-binding universal stress UspA family protein
MDHHLGPAVRATVDEVATRAMYQHILAATDGSKIADQAVDHAIALAVEQHAELRIIHVVDPRVSSWGEFSWADMGTILADLNTEGQCILDRAAERARRVGVPITTALVEARQGHVGEVIATEAQRSGADLIVVGTHGRTGFSRLMLGSVAQVTLRAATVPVLTLPPRRSRQ